MPSLKPKSTIPRLLDGVRPYVWWIVLAGSSVLIKEIARVSVYIFLGKALDVVVGVSSANLERLLVIEGALVLAIGVNGFLAVISMFRSVAMVIHDFRRESVRNILRMPVRFFTHHRTGDLVSRINNDSEAMEGFVIYVCQTVIFRTLMLLMTMGFMLYLNWKIALIHFVVLPLGMFLSERVSRPLERKNRAYHESLGAIGATASDVVQGAVEMKAFGMESHLGGVHDRAVDEGVRIQNSIAGTRARMDVAGRITYYLPLLITYGYGAILILKGEMTPGEMLAMQYVIDSLDLCIDFMFTLFDNIRKCTAAGKRLFEIWDSPKEGDVEEPAPAADDGNHAVVIKDLEFSYETSEPGRGGDLRLFKDINLTIDAGETVALVGRSGCGKSTLLHLIAGFYLPRSGLVSVFGHPPAGSSLARARACIALVSQDPYLFPVSIGDNIAYGKANDPSADGRAEFTQGDAVTESARNADIHDFIHGLEGGYDSLVGERGVKLSGGQRQRIAIARAFYKDAPLLLLDEPTSALDANTENRVQRSIDALMKGRTTIVAAHRLSTIKSVDRIYVMEKGSIVESGTHDELMAGRGLYYELYRLQSAESSRETP